MINRENYFAVQEYLLHLREERQLDEGTIKQSWMACRLILEYADDRPLYDLADSRPTFPEYAAAIKGKLTRRIMTARYQAKMLENVRHFFTWARMYKRGVWAKVSEAWIDNLRVRRSTLNAEKEHKTHVFWDMGDLEKVARYKPQTLREERTQAAILFMFLSGMRITAFCSLPVDCVDLQEGRIEQKPSKGVITKNRKAAVTFLLPIPELMPSVIAWDKKIRKAGAKTWLAKLDRDGQITTAERSGNIQGRRGLFDADIREFCPLVGVPILSAHKLRHAHGVYGVRNARTVEELKAVSQNMMHANLGITDGIYGILPEENIKRVINTLSPRSTPPPQKDTGEITPELLDVARMLLAQMKK